MDRRRRNYDGDSEFLTRMGQVRLVSLASLAPSEWCAHLNSTRLSLSGSIELKEMTKIMTCLLELEGIGKVGKSWKEEESVSTVYRGQPKRRPPISSITWMWMVTAGWSWESSYTAVSRTRSSSRCSRGRRWWRWPRRSPLTCAWCWWRTRLWTRPLAVLSQRYARHLTRTVYLWALTSDYDWHFPWLVTDYEARSADN